MEASNAGSIPVTWKTLYRLAALAALLMNAIIVAQLIVFMSAPPPLEGSAIDWFSLFQRNTLAGLVGFELLMIVYTLISVPIVLCLYHALRQTDPAFSALYVMLSLIGIVSFIAARPAFEMLSLSGQFAAATGEMQKSAILAAGEATLAAFHGTAFHVSYVLGSISGLIISLVMLKSHVFSRGTAYVRIGSSVFDFGLYVPAVGVFLAIFSVLFLFVWNIMIARRLLELARSPSEHPRARDRAPAVGPS